MSRRIVLEMLNGLREICGTVDDLEPRDTSVLPERLDDVPVYHGGQRVISAVLARVSETYVLYRET